MLPKEFKDRMSKLPGVDSEHLFCEIENGEAVKAFRLNGVKTDMARFESSGASVDRQPLPSVKNAYYTKEKFPGSLPEHHSGAIYVQDLSAMATVCALTVERGWRVLDSCAAPGGKTTQLAAAVGESGVVVANEYESARARVLQSNVERMGCKNTVVLNLDTAILAQTYPEEFDLVLCDAPCSGEGMFRKNEQAICEWSVENVRMCAARQREILANVVRCLKKGGKLLYSTCTFSTEENEENVAWLLDSYPELELLDVSDEIKNITADGVMIDGCEYDMSKTRRFYPHISRGEGQFIALLGHKGRAETAACGDSLEQGAESEAKAKDRAKGGKKRENKNNKFQNKQDVELIELGKAFFEQNLYCEPLGTFAVHSGKLWLVPDVRLTERGVVAPGVCVGEAQKGRFIPHHQLFSAYGNAFRRKLCLNNASDLTKAYLLGEELSLADVELRKTEDKATENTATEDAANGKDLYYCSDDNANGWAAVLIGGCACGGAKISGALDKYGVFESGVIKNHYPKGLRNKRIG